MFSVHITPEKFESATITGYFRVVFGDISGREITGLSQLHHLRKASLSKCCPSKLQRKAGVFKFLQKIVLEKHRFCDGLVRTVGQTLEIKLRFQVSPA